MIEVMVVEDHHLVRKAIIKLLSNVDGIRVVAEAENGEEAIKIAEEKSPQIILMDLKMPGMGGREAIRQILQNNAAIKIIVLTAYSKDPLPIQLLQAGASGYLTKDVLLEEMVKAIRTVYSGKHYISPSVVQGLTLQSLQNPQQSPLSLLSDREKEVMTMITDGKSIQDIVEALKISPKTINTYRYRLYEKLEIQSDVELTLLAKRYGILKH